MGINQNNGIQLRIKREIKSHTVVKPLPDDVVFILMRKIGFMRHRHKFGPALLTKEIDVQGSTFGSTQRSAEHHTQGNRSNGKINLVKTFTIKPLYSATNNTHHVHIGDQREDVNIPADGTFCKRTPPRPGSANEASKHRR